MLFSPLLWFRGNEAPRSKLQGISAKANKKGRGNFYLSTAWDFLH